MEQESYLASRDWKNLIVSYNKAFGHVNSVSQASLKGANYDAKDVIARLLQHFGSRAEFADNTLTFSGKEKEARRCLQGEIEKQKI